MDIRFLESFVAVVEFGSIAEAARRLNITPATLAQRLKTLENDLGHPLVNRMGRTVRPTGSGLAVLSHVRELVKAAHDLKVIAANDVPAGQLRLGSTATALTGLLPKTIKQVSLRFPNIEFLVRPGSSAELYHGVMARELDAALIVRPQFPIPKSAGWLKLREEPLVLITAKSLEPGHPHQIITDNKFIRYDRNQWGGQLVDDYLRLHKLKVSGTLELDALDAIAALVHGELGVAIVPDWARPWPENLELRKIALPDGGTRQTGVLWNRSGSRIAAVKAFVGVCGESAKEET